MTIMATAYLGLRLLDPGRVSSDQDMFSMLKASDGEKAFEG
jgi:hypothetical protein